MSAPSQNGKNPLWGPSVPQPMPSRTASKTTSPPRRARNDAVRRSARRMGEGLLLLQQSSLAHEVFVESLVLFDPLHVLGAGGKGGLQRAVVHVFLPLRGLADLPQEGDIPVHRLLGHAGRTEDAAE